MPLKARKITDQQKDLIDKCKKLLIKLKLNTPSREIDLVFKRAIIVNILRREYITYQTIGIMFNRHHSTIINLNNIYKQEKNKLEFKKLEQQIKQQL